MDTHKIPHFILTQPLKHVHDVYNGISSLDLGDYK